VESENEGIFSWYEIYFLSGYLDLII